jgi:hypothetical protein
VGTKTTSQGLLQQQKFQDYGKTEFGLHLYQFTRTKKRRISYLRSEPVITGSVMDNPLMVPSKSGTANGTEKT